MWVTDIAPPDGASDVSLGSPIVVTFSRPLDPDSVDEGAFWVYANGNALAKSVSLSPDRRTVTLELLLPPASTVILTIEKQLRDADGTPLESTRVRFSTVAKAHPGDPGTEHKALGMGQWRDWFQRDNRAAREALFHLDLDDIPVLIDLLALETLWKLDPDDAQTARLFEAARTHLDIDGLTKRLRGNDRLAALAAARTLGKHREIPDVALPILIAALTNGTEEEKLGAIAAMQEYGPLAASAIPFLIDELRRHEVPNDAWLSGDGNPKRALVMMGPEAIEPMVDLLQRAPEPHMRRRAARVLGAILEEPTESEVYRRLAGYRHRIRQCEPKVVAALRNAGLRDPVPWVRARAANGLRGAPSIAAKIHHIEVLLEAARFEDGWAKLEGPVTSWTNLDSTVIEALRQCDQAKNDQLVAITTHYGVGAHKLAQTLAQTLDHEGAAERPELIESTLKALGRFGKDARDVESRIREFIAHEHQAIRAAARDAIVKLR